MTTRKKLDPSSVANSIVIPSTTKPEPEQKAPKAPRAPRARKPVAEPVKPVKTRHETSVRFSPETREALDAILSFCSQVPELQQRIIQKTAFEMGLYVLSKLHAKEFRHACLHMPDLSAATGGAPLRIPMKFYTEVVVPLINTYSDIMKSRKGANVSRLTIIGLHHLHAKLVESPEEFKEMLAEACDSQYDEGLDIC